LSAGEGARGRGKGFVVRAAFTIAVFLAGILAAPALAQEPTPSDDDVNAIAKQLYCPVCENVPLDVCPTQACEQWRATIREKLTLGWSEQQIKDYFVAQYGDRVLATPPARGFNWLVYLLPPLALAAAGVVLWQTMGRWRRAGAEAPPASAPPATDPYVQQLEEELKRRG
jgi:cytochrome c-type biogenesis protein CcmH